MITFDQALTAREFHYDGAEPAKIERWRRNGRTQTWKTRPGEFRIPVKWGLRGYSYITHHDAGAFHTEEDCPLRDR